MPIKSVIIVNLQFNNYIGKNRHVYNMLEEAHITEYLCYLWF